MILQERIEVLVKLGNVLRTGDDYLEALLHQVSHKNLWFTKENYRHAIAMLSRNLTEENLNKWAKTYFIDDNIKSKNVGLVFSGLAPLENFHDALCTFIQGHKAQLKLDERDELVIPYLIKIMDRMNDRSATYLKVVDKITNFDAIIANASPSNYLTLKKYFKDTPAIIRKRKNAIAVLTQADNQDDLQGISDDIFTYFGFSVRNLSKIYIPKAYDFNPLMEKLHEQKEIILHGKYKSNFDYNYSIHVLNKDMIVANGCIILSENQQVQSRIAGLHYEFYESQDDLTKKLYRDKDAIELISAHQVIEGFFVKPFGKCLQYELHEYQSQYDVMEFLLSIA